MTDYQAIHDDGFKSGKAAGYKEGYAAGSQDAQCYECDGKGEGSSGMRGWRSALAAADRKEWEEAGKGLGNIEVQVDRMRTIASDD